MVVDEGDPDPPPAEIPTLAAPTLMEGAGGRARRWRGPSSTTPLACGEALKATAILPVKRFDDAKRRLAAGLDDERRRALAAAMLGDVLEAIGAARTIERTILVSGDPGAQELAAEAGAEVVPDPADEGHVEAALAGIARAEAEGAELRRPPPRRLPAARPA